jgi:hypothetical protein
VYDIPTHVYDIASDMARPYVAPLLLVVLYKGSVRVKGFEMGSQDRERGRQKYASTSSVFRIQEGVSDRYGRVQHWLGVKMKLSYAIVPVARVHMYAMDSFEPQTSAIIVDVERFTQSCILVDRILNLALLGPVDATRRLIINVY